MDDVINRKDLAVIARDHVKSWQTLGPFLDLSTQNETSITNSNLSYELQKRKCLEMWSEMKGTGATYGSFIRVAEEAHELDLAHAVKDMVKS